jgi:hypothetical protein
MDFKEGAKEVAAAQSNHLLGKRDIVGGEQKLNVASCARGIMGP